MWMGHIPPPTRLREMSQVPASSAQPPPARWHPHWGESEVLKQLGQHFLNTHPVQAQFQARGGGWGWSHTDKLTSHETGTWTPQPQGDKAPPPALPPRAEEVKLVGGLRSSVAVVQSSSMEPFRAMWAMERPRLSGQGHRRRSGADSGSVCPGAGRRTALCVRFLTRAVWRVCSS